MFHPKLAIRSFSKGTNKVPAFDNPLPYSVNKEFCSPFSIYKDMTHVAVQRAHILSKIREDMSSRFGVNLMWQMDKQPDRQTDVFYR